MQVQLLSHFCARNEWCNGSIQGIGYCGEVVSHDIVDVESGVQFPVVPLVCVSGRAAIAPGCKPGPQWFVGSSPTWRIKTIGSVPEWIKGSDCKSDGDAYVGSNLTWPIKILFIGAIAVNFLYI